MNILMIGGTGQIGYYTLQHLAGRGHHLEAIGLEPEALAASLPAAVNYTQANTESCTVDELVQLLTGSDVVIYAAGADGRNQFARPAIKGFRNANVHPMKALVAAMLSLKARKLVILGSYYTAMHRMFPELKLTAYSPYIRSRQEQMELVLRLAGNKLEVVVLELPYIFGAAPGKKPLWRFITDAILLSQNPMPVHRGGTACITLQQAGMATALAAITDTGSRVLPIGNANHTYRDIYRMFAEAMGVDKQFQPHPPSFFHAKAKQQQDGLQKAGLEGAYNPLHLLAMEDHLLYIDPLPAMQTLGYGYEDIAAAIGQTVQALKPGSYQAQTLVANEK